ncbi:hypothetical protein ACP4OV_026816 [Aristida adscensionis]
MLDEWGHIPCSVERFCDLLGKLSTPQMDRVKEFGLGCMLTMRSVKMRPALLKFLIQKYDPVLKLYTVRLNEGYSITHSDVECIMGLENNGVLVKPNDDITYNDLPSKFQNHWKNEGMRIENLISDIVLYNSTDDDFVRMFLLVMLGTVIAPVSQKYVPYSYFAFVENIETARTINWNRLTVGIIESNLRKVKENIVGPKRWPFGNLALTQYCYWEKCRPIYSNFDYSGHSRPFMRIWDEAAAYRRYVYDSQNGRGHGTIVSDLNKHCSTNEHAGSNNIKTPDSKGINVCSACKENSKKIDSFGKRLSSVEKTFGNKLSAVEENIKYIPDVRRCLKILFDRLGQPDVFPCGSPKENKSNGDGTAQDSYIPDSDSHEESSSTVNLEEVNYSSESYTVAERVKGYGRKRKPSCKPRSPMVMFNKRKRAAVKDDMEKVINKYLSNHVIDSYGALIQHRVKDSRLICPVWHGYMLSKEQIHEQSKLQLNQRFYQNFRLRIYEHDMSKGIERVTALARNVSPGLPTNLSNWSINMIKKRPMQADGCSCGLYVLKFMELWNGRSLERWFTQEEIHIFRRKMVHEIIFSELNEDQVVQKEIEKILKQK